MQHQTVLEKAAAIIVAFLFILVAWGNTIVLLSMSVVGLVVLLFIARKNSTRSSVPVIILGFMISIIAVLLASNR